MTQQLTHLLCERAHTHTVMNTNTAASTCCTEGGLRSTETMWSDPAHPHPHAHPAHTVCLRRDSCARLLSLVIFVRPSACLQITLSSSSHLYWHSTHFVFCCLFFFFLLYSLHIPLRPISASLTFFHGVVPSPRESSPAGAHYRRAWSWLPGSRLICHIPVPSRRQAQQIGSVAECSACVSVLGEMLGLGVEGIVYNSGECRKALRPVLVTVLFCDSNSCLLLRAFPCCVCLVAGIVYSDSCSFVHGFVSYSGKEMVPWQSFILSQDAWDGLQRVEGGRQQWKERFMTQTHFQHIGFIKVYRSIHPETWYSNNYTEIFCVTTASAAGIFAFFVLYIEIRMEKTLALNVATHYGSGMSTALCGSCRSLKILESCCIWQWSRKCKWMDDWKVLV